MERRNFFATIAAYFTSLTVRPAASAPVIAKDGCRFRVFEPRNIAWKTKPSNPLAVPTPDEIPESLMDEIDLGNSRLVTRSQGLSNVAGRNRELLTDWDCNARFRPWAMLVEVGTVLNESIAIPLAATTITVEKNGTGTADTAAYFDVRLVRPTLDELSRYSLHAEAI